MLSSDKLECLTVEITKPHLKSFLFSTWYRPLQSYTELFNLFEQIIDKIDAEGSEVYLLGDPNCNFLLIAIPLVFWMSWIFMG